MARPRSRWAGPGGGRRRRARCRGEGCPRGSVGARRARDVDRRRGGSPRPPRDGRGVERGDRAAGAGVAASVPRRAVSCTRLSRAGAGHTARSSGGGVMAAAASGTPSPMRARLDRLATPVRRSRRARPLMDVRMARVAVDGRRALDFGAPAPGPPAAARARKRGGEPVDMGDLALLRQLCTGWRATPPYKAGPARARADRGSPALPALGRHGRSLVAERPHPPGEAPASGALLRPSRTGIRTAVGRRYRRQQVVRQLASAPVRAGLPALAAVGALLRPRTTRSSRCPRSRLRSRS
jgi:hypothetical protein